MWQIFSVAFADQIKNLSEHHDLADVTDEFDFNQKGKYAEGRYTNICDGAQFKKAWCGSKWKLGVGD